MKPAYNKLSSFEVMKRISIANPNIVVCGEYVNNHSGIKCYCTKCGFGKDFDWTPYPVILFKEKACPICNNKQLGGKLIQGINDLETWCKNNDRNDLLEEWDYEENKSDSETPNLPSEISKANPKIKVHWKCNICGYKFISTTNKRTILNKKTGHSCGCPHCSKAGTSFSEQAILYYVKDYFREIIHRDRNTIGMELDIYIPDIRTAIEFDGGVFHKNKIERDNLKDKVCKNANIRLIRIRDISLSKTDYAEIIECDGGIQNKKSMDMAIETLLTKLNLFNFDVNTSRDYAKIVVDYKKRELEESLQARYPEVAKEWNIERNNGLLPTNFSSGEAYKAWWKCSICGYEWNASIYSRTNGKHGCPRCGYIKQGSNYSSNRAKEKSVYDYCIENGFNLLLDEWDYEENKKDILTPNIPQDASYMCNRKIHWSCKKCGYKWIAEPYFRYNGKCNCPACNNKAVFLGQNDLKTWCNTNQRLDLLDDWDFENNLRKDKTPILPENIKYDSYSKVHWKCKKCGHMWRGRLADRTINGKNCAICARKIIAQKNNKRVICLETGMIFESVKEAGIFIKGKPSTRINECCNGNCETAYGYHWKFYDEVTNYKE